MPLYIQWSDSYAPVYSVILDSCNITGWLDLTNRIGGYGATVPRGYTLYIQWTDSYAPVYSVIW